MNFTEVKSILTHREFLDILAIDVQYLRCFKWGDVQLVALKYQYMMFTIKHTWFSTVFAASARISQGRQSALILKTNFDIRS